MGVSWEAYASLSIKKIVVQDKKHCYLKVNIFSIDLMGTTASAYTNFQQHIYKTSTTLVVINIINHSPVKIPSLKSSNAESV